MLVADDDDDVLEHEAEEQARNFLLDDDTEEGDPDPDAGDTGEHSRILPLVLQLLEAHTAGGGRLDVHISAIRERLRRCETFLTDMEQKTLSDDPNDERRSTELLGKRTELLSEHTSRRRPKRDREDGS